MTQTHRILKSYPISAAPAIAPGEITLREWGEGQWVTHFHNLQDNGYYHGHYFSDLAQAEADFEERVRKELSPNTELPLLSEASVKVSAKIYGGILAVKEAGTVNLFDVNLVKVQAVALGYPETADWIKANPERYAQGVFQGFDVELIKR